MFPFNMPRAIACLLIAFALLSGCTGQRPVETPRQDSQELVKPPSVEQWLDQMAQVEEMETPRIMEQLKTIDKNAGTSQLFYFGVLNQQLQNYGAWTVARDTFQQLQETETLPIPQRQLANILREYNQSRINAHSRYSALLIEQEELRRGISQAEVEKRQLEQKIQALTEVETAISTRREE